MNEPTVEEILKTTEENMKAHLLNERSQMLISYYNNANKLKTSIDDIKPDVISFTRTGEKIYSYSDSLVKELKTMETALSNLNKAVNVALNDNKWDLLKICIK